MKKLVALIYNEGLHPQLSNFSCSVLAGVTKAVSKLPLKAVSKLTLKAVTTLLND